MSLRVCNVPGCPTLVTSGRCEEHQRQAEQRRGSAAVRGYDTNHRSLKAAWQRRINTGEPVKCWRCGRSLAGLVSNQWHLGHDDNDRTIYRGPECIPCNTATSGR